MVMDTYLLYGIPVVGLVMALVKIAREMGVASKYAPSLSLALGVIGGVGIAYQRGGDLVEGLVMGLVIGANASGFYDVAKFTNSTTT